MAINNDGWLDLKAIKRKSKFKLSLQKMAKNLDSPAAILLDVLSFILVSSWLIVKYLGLSIWLFVKAVSIGFFIFIKSLADWSHSKDADFIMRLGYASGFDYSEKSGSGKHTKKKKFKSNTKARVRNNNSEKTILDVLSQHVKNSN